MKKTFAIVLVLVMVFALATTASANETRSGQGGFEAPGSFSENQSFSAPQSGRGGTRIEMPDVSSDVPDVQRDDQSGSQEPPQIKPESAANPPRIMVDKVLPPTVVPEIIPELEISDLPTPLSSGMMDLVVEIKSDVLTPVLGDRITLTSFVYNPDNMFLTYQWQIDRGFGWENIRNANGTEFVFRFTPELAHCAFRVFVDKMTV